jgi:hypothetical protein
MEQQGDQGAVVAGRELSSVESAEQEELIERIEGYAYGKGGVMYFTQRTKQENTRRTVTTRPRRGRRVIGQTKMTKMTKTEPTLH